jgi:hypothetical protein
MRQDYLAHLIALFARCAEGAFPIAFIAARRTLCEAREQVPELPDLSLEERDDLQRIRAQDASKGKNIGEAPLIDGDELLDYARNIPRPRSLRLFYLDKQIANKASIRPGRHPGIAEILTRILESLTKPAAIEISDAEASRRDKPRRM